MLKPSPPSAREATYYPTSGARRPFTAHTDLSASAAQYNESSQLDELDEDVSEKQTQPTLSEVGYTSQLQAHSFADDIPFPIHHTALEKDKPPLPSLPTLPSLLSMTHDVEGITHRDHKQGVSDPYHDSLDPGYRQRAVWPPLSLPTMQAPGTSKTMRPTQQVETLHWPVLGLQSLASLAGRDGVDKASKQAAYPMSASTLDHASARPTTSDQVPDLRIPFLHKHGVKDREHGPTRSLFTLTTLSTSDDTEEIRPGTAVTRTDDPALLREDAISAGVISSNDATALYTLYMEELGSVNCILDPGVHTNGKTICVEREAKS